MSESIINPNTDGHTHIRVDDHAASELGKVLRIGYFNPIYHPTYGAFNSVLSALVYFQDETLNSLRYVQDVRSLDVIQNLKTPKPGSIKKVIEILKWIVENDVNLQHQIKASTLPFKFYNAVTFAGGDVRIYPIESMQWYVKTLEDIRRDLNAKK